MFGCDLLWKISIFMCRVIDWSITLVFCFQCVICLVVRDIFLCNFVFPKERRRSPDTKRLETTMMISWTWHHFLKLFLHNTCRSLSLTSAAPVKMCDCYFVVVSCTSWKMKDPYSPPVSFSRPILQSSTPVLFSSSVIGIKRMNFRRREDHILSIWPDRVVDEWPTSSWFNFLCSQWGWNLQTL